MAKKEHGDLGREGFFGITQTTLRLLSIFGIITFFFFGTLIIYNQFHEDDSISLVGDGVARESLINMTSPAKINSKTLLRNMAFELSTMRTSSKDQLEKLITDIEETRDAVGRQAEDLKKQREALQSQATALRIQGQQMSQLQVSMSLPSSLARKGKPLRREKLLSDDPKEWRQHKFVQHGTYGFIQFSSYRVSPSKFVTMGLAALRLAEHRIFQGCMWFGNDGKDIEGDLNMLHTNEHHYARYEPVVLECNLKRGTGETGGYVVAAMDDEEFVIIREEKAELEEPTSFQYQLTECSPPLFGELSGRYVWEWFEYHRVIVGVDHFLLYNVNALNSNVMDHLKDYSSEGMLEVIDFSDAMSYSVWWWGQSITQHDCIYRSRRNSKWITMIDLDEFVDARPPHSVGSLLRKYEDKPWITHGSVWWGVHVCNDREGDDIWGLEQMTYHWPGHYCQNKELYPDWKFCLSDAGHRKLFVNPRKTNLMQVHKVLDPLEGGQDLSSDDEMVHNHFQQYNLNSLTDSTKKRCGQKNSMKEDVSWWILDLHLSDTVKKIRECPVKDRNCVEKIE